ncbi:hypothetical protein [Umezawaea tangerina]|uniref:Excreted virulence factor EspC (Type VII ESX diderm) n=1 Tax=Umezawaea tangerina TaxID=84725 RepID=A0A2T0TDR2_9PSEU|nr:hypothetical protein [Umezawaea tangerina]PRY43806.1 hypothetical protein CLV43_103555 [Umezawaea tangerina]
MTGFEVDRAKLAEGAGEFTGFAEQAGRIAADLSGALDSFGVCWGADEIGQSFASGHVAAAQESFGKLDGISARFDGVGERFAATAQTYGQVDGGAAGTLRDVHS